MLPGAPPSSTNASALNETITQPGAALLKVTDEPAILEKTRDVVCPDEPSLEMILLGAGQPTVVTARAARGATDAIPSEGKVTERNESRNAIVAKNVNAFFIFPLRRFRIAHFTLRTTLF